MAFVPNRHRSTTPAPSVFPSLDRLFTPNRADTRLPDSGAGRPAESGAAHAADPVGNDAVEAAPAEAAESVKGSPFVAGGAEYIAFCQMWAPPFDFEELELLAD